MNLNIPEELMNGLKALDIFLEGRNLDVNILLLGANGMKSIGMITRVSMDLDSHNKLEQEIRTEILNIAFKLNLPTNWLNDHVSDIPLPEGYIARLIVLNTDLSNITFKLSVEKIS
ncbi:MAG: hypothetical protein EOO88_18720 [Pedobacter sp.]|nr:MAG: hypothetical protein EOO88_18720 [Pedobacter sp.]